LPFGVRIPEHTMWVRQATNTDRESSQEHGVAAAYVGESYAAELMGIAANYQVNPDKYRNRGYSVTRVRAQLDGRGWRELARHVCQNDRDTNQDLKTTHQVHGAMARAGFGEKFAILAEFDGIFTSRPRGRLRRLRAVRCGSDQGVARAADGRKCWIRLPEACGRRTRSWRAPRPRYAKVGGWLSIAWFVYSHFDVRLDLIKRTGDDTQLLGQAHIYL